VGVLVAGGLADVNEHRAAGAQQLVGLGGGDPPGFIGFSR
jgi:hypothetical protein